MAVLNVLISFAGALAAKPQDVSVHNQLKRAPASPHEHLPESARGNPHGDQSEGSRSHLSTWSCTVLSNTSLQSGVWWSKHNCTGTVPGTPVPHIGPVVVNIGHALVTGEPGAPIIRPAVAKTDLGLAKLHQLAGNASSESPGFVPLIGVNGGYFFEVNRADFIDDVCFGKFRSAALKPVSASDPNAGVGDCLTILNGTYASSNCDKVGNSKPVAAILDHPPRFVQQDRAERLPPSVQWAIAAGPNLVSLNTSSGVSYIDIRGDNVNILEHASNTALALKGAEFMLVTFDGEDNCTEYKPLCGVNSRQFAAFLLDHLEVDTAMEMDQGGSTAMWVQGQPGTVAGEPGIVSNPGHSERLIFNGVFIGTSA